MPHNSILLVDTYNTLQGVKNAIIIGKKLREQNADLLAIRLDSGDMAELSKKARKLLDEAGFKKTGILASNSLDEYVIEQFKKEGAKISSWGVGTHLVTAYDQPALDGVYKLSALCTSTGEWEYKLKISEEPIKTSNPGRHQVRRFFSNGQYLADVIYDLTIGITDSPECVLIEKSMPPVHLDDYDACVDLLEPIFRDGKYVQQPKSIHDIRKMALEESERFVTSHEVNKPYAVGLEKRLATLKTELVKKLKSNSLD